MADITKLPQHYFGKAETVSVPNPKLLTAIDADDLTIVLNSPLTFSDGTFPTGLAFTLVIRNATTKYPEEIYVQAGELSADGLTITLSGTNQRGIDNAPDSSGGVDFLSGTAARASAHPEGSEVRVSISPLFWYAMSQVQQGALASGGANWKVGNEVDEDITWYAINGDANPPYFRYLSASNKFVVAADGVTEIDMASGGVTTASGAVDITASNITLELTDTTQLAKTSAGAGDANKLAQLGAAGTLDDTLIPATIARDSELSGISSVDGTTLTGGSNADALHVHPMLANGGSFTKNTADASADLVIAHGLGKTPVEIDFTYFVGAESNSYNGVWTSAPTHRCYGRIGNGGSYTSALNTTKAIKFATNTTGGAGIDGTITADATNFTIAWTKLGAASGSFDCFWTAKA